MRDPLLGRLVEYETVEDGDPGGPAEPPPSEPEPSDPGEPESTPPEAWAGPSREEWAEAQRQLAQANELVAMLQTPTYEPEPELQLPEYDPFDPEAAVRYMEARDQRLLSQIQQTLAPITEQYQTDSANRWAEETFGRLGVPEDEHWREGVLFTSAGFQQFDAYGRPLVHPQQAAAQGYEFLKRFAEAERAAERERIKTETAQTDDAIRARAAAPEMPAGPAGAEGTPTGIDELGAARIWREKQAAIS